MIEIKNLSGRLQYVDSLKKIGETVLAKERKDHLDLSVVLLRESKMRELNRMYRGKDEPTNVLAFPGGNDKIPSPSALRTSGSKDEAEGYSGELVLCPAVIRRDAAKYGITFKAELYRIFIHGLLHLLEYDHEKDADFKRMSQKEKQYLLLTS